MKLVRTSGPHPALLSVAPALDVVLVLIFFIILSTSFLLQPGIAVTVPESPFLLAPQRDPQVISITAAPLSSVYFEDGEVSLVQLRDRLGSQRSRTRTVIIKADRNAPFEKIAGVVAVTIELGFPTVMATSERP